MTVDLVAVLFVGAALIAIGAFAVAWRRDLAAALGGVPIMFAGAGIAFVGVARFAAPGGPALTGQEFGVLLSVAALAVTALGVGLAGREGSR